MKPRPPFWFLLLVLVSIIAGWRTVSGVFTLAWDNEAYTHILLVLPVSLSMIYLDWPAARSQSAPAWGAGSILLAAALIAAGVARWKSALLTTDVQLSIYSLALVLWWMGAFIGCFGTRVFRSLLFPMCFLLWLVPFPVFLVDWIVSLLQQGSAYAARLLFMTVGVPVVQDGIILTIPGLAIEVAQECSSIRSSMILVVTTMVLAQLFLRSEGRKLLVVALAIPLSVAKNGLRIFTIAMLGTRVDPGFLNGKLHQHGGFIFLAIALIVIFGVLWILRERQDEGSEIRLPAH
jgi:exosortase